MHDELADRETARFVLGLHEATDEDDRVPETGAAVSVSPADQGLGVPADEECEERGARLEDFSVFGCCERREYGGSGGGYEGRAETGRGWGAGCEGC